MRYVDVDLEAAGIQAHQIALPLEEATCLSLDSEVEEAAADLAAADFDAAPVVSAGIPVGVFNSSITEPAPGSVVADVMRPLSAPLIVSGHMAMGNLIERMCSEPFLFVLEEQGITGFVTAADLGAVPVRTHFYLRLAHLESLLGNYLRARFPDQEQAIAMLKDKRRETHAKIAGDLRRQDLFIDEFPVWA